MNNEVKLQWHPAFCAAARLEFNEDMEELEFYSEYNLSRKPLQIDLLIVEKNRNVRLRNQIGHIFRQNNIIEYKCPGDVMSIDDFYKAVAYACMYKALGERVDAVKADELTISMMRESYPAGMAAMLNKQGIEIEKVREEDLKVISEYFAKLPDGFVEELKTYQDYEEYQDRKIYIYVSGDGVTDVKNDVSRGDYWILDNNKEIEDQLAYCTMESVSYNISYRKKGTNLLHAWNRYNPSIYDYSDDKEYFKYLYNEDNTEEAYFIGEEPVLYAMDDEARIFALLMTEDEKGFEILDKAPNIRKKAFYIRNMMDYAFETVDETAYWNRYFTETE